jgi:hypothetical protein
MTVAGNPDYALELLLSRVENEYPGIIASLDNATRSDHESDLIRALVTTQMARDPFYRGWISEDVQEIQDALRIALLEDSPGMTEGEIQAEWEHYARANIVQADVGADPANIAVAYTPWLMQAYFGSVQMHGLSILRAPPCSFITADSPLYLYDRYRLAGIEAPASDTSFLEEAEFTFPITARHAALITPKQFRELVDVPEDVAAVVNARTVRSAAREIYCHPQYAADKLKRDLGMWWWRRALQPSLR